MPDITDIISGRAQIEAFIKQGSPIGQQGIKLRADANTIFTPRDLEFIEAAVMATEFEPLLGNLLTPFDTTVPDWYERVTARTSGSSGKPTLVKTATTQINNVDQDLEEDSWNIRQWAIGATWSRRELVASQFLNRPLDTSSTIAAVQALFTQLDDVIFDGLTESGLRGWFDTETVDRTESQVGINENFTTTEILNLLNNTINSISDDTNSVERPNRLALSSRAFDYIASTPMSVDNSRSILDQLVMNQTFITTREQVLRIPKLRNITAGGALGETLAVFNFDAMKVRTAIMNPTTEGGVMQVGLQFRQLYVASMSEVQWRRPKSARFIFNTNRTSAP